MSKARDKKIKKDKLEKDYLSQFPLINFIDSQNAPESFEKDIKKAYRQVLLDLQKKKTIKDAFFYEFLKMFKKLHADTVSGESMKKLIYWVCNHELFQKIYPPQSQPLVKNLKLSKFLYATQQIRSIFIEKIEEKTNIDKYLPDCFATFGIYGNGFYVRFHAVFKEKTDGGTIYKHAKTLNVDGVEYELWFSKHALDRVIQRVGSILESPNVIMGEFISHAPFFFNGFTGQQHLLCCYMPSPLRNNKNIFDDVGIELPVLAGHKQEDRLMKYLYFPFVVKGKRIICKSALLPGFAGTPEYYLKEKLSKMPSSDELDAECIKMFYDRNYQMQNAISAEFCYISILFHKFGMPQYFQGEFNCFPIIATFQNELKQN